ncbi:MAG: glycerophosphodiester phosphodiesterase, partial [Flavisolibacter sp.]
FIICTLCVLSCQQNNKVPVPDDNWALFDSVAANPLSIQYRNWLEGVFTIEENQEFGPLAALKWSYTLNGRDSIYHLSMFCEKDMAYFICEGRKLHDKVLLNGYWRKMDNDKTGKARFEVSFINEHKITIDGSYGYDDDIPNQNIRLSYLRPLYKKTPVEIVAHRGGGRNTDFLPASENSIELILEAARFGATGVEIDVQLTKDSIPVLYHDANINDRLTEKNGVHGTIGDYSFAELKEIQLKKGEQIPTLRDALDSIIHKTPLQFIWLDAKEKNSLTQLRKLQREFTSVAAANGRKIEITIGIHDKKVFNAFKLLADYRNIPSACELDPEDVTDINARIWAPLWIHGLQQEEVAAMHSQGRKAFVWTLDQPKKIREFIAEGNYDGIVSNYPSIVAYYHYTTEDETATAIRY